MYASDLKHPNMSLEDKLHALYDLNRVKDIDLSFRPPYLKLLEAFGNPYLKLPPVIHVAGTNGKGSTIAILRTILEEAGYKVQAYTSPHLCEFNERIYLAGQNIIDSDLEDLIDEAITLNEGRDVTFFEITTAIAFAAFARVPADIVLLETGLGGRLDCTNVVKAPLVSVICSISHDHMEHLGNTLPEIAAEKAGIIKPGTPCVIAPQSEEARQAGVLDVFTGKAAENTAPLYSEDAQWSIEDQENQIRFHFAGADHFYPKPNLSGTHQIDNAGTALVTLKVVEKQFPVPDTAIKKGLENIHWPGRMQKLNSKDFNVPAPWEIWLDVGHNEGAGRVIQKQIQTWQDQDERPIHIIVAMMNHKDPQGFLEPILPHIQSFHVINIPGEPNSFKASELAEKLQQTNVTMAQASTLQTALTQITEKNQKPGRILIAGSLYLAGHVLKDTSNQLHNRKPK